MRLSLALILIIQSLLCNAQNLAPNPDFELYSVCPAGNEIADAIAWVEVVPTSDYFACNYQDNSNCPNGHSGQAYAGVSVYRPSWGVPYREYIGAPLTAPLTAGVKYYCEFWVRLECSKCWTSDALGAWFTMGQPPDPSGPQMIFNVTPQILNPQYRQLDQRYSWMKICGTFVALGGENFITIGSFKDDNQSTFTELPGCNGNYGVHWSYYHIDDVLVEVWDSTRVYDCDDSTVYENPNQDPSELFAKECEITLPNIITPNNDGFNDRLVIPDTLLEKWNLKIYSRWGTEVEDLHSHYTYGWDGQKNDVDPITDGVYYYILTSTTQKCHKKGVITVLSR